MVLGMGSVAGLEAGQAYPAWMVLVAGWSSCGEDPSTGDSAGPGGTEDPGKERPLLSLS